MANAAQFSFTWHAEHSPLFSKVSRFYYQKTGEYDVWEIATIDGDVLEGDYYYPLYGDNNRGFSAVNFMVFFGQLPVAESEDFDALALPLAEANLELWLLRPHEVSALHSLHDLNLSELSNLRQQMTNRWVEVSLPECSISARVSFAEPLVNLGVEDLFSETASAMQGMHAESGIYVNSAWQRSQLDLTAQGGRLTTQSTLEWATPDLSSWNPGYSNLVTGSIVTPIGPLYVTRTNLPLPLSFNLDRPFAAVLWNREAKRPLAAFQVKYPPAIREDASNWQYSAWLGWIHHNQLSPWVYLTNEGWCYSNALAPSGSWFYTAGRGWCWTAYGVYP